MPKTTQEPELHERLRDELEAIPGVRRVFVEGPPVRVHLVCDATEGPVPVQAAAEALLLQQGTTGQVELSYVTSAQTERRVRFLGLSVEHPRAGVAAVTVELEWNGDTFAGRAEGEGGANGELRICANATLAALEKVLGGELTFQLVGIKGVHIFDHQLVAALLRSPEAPDRRLIGVSLALEEFNRSAALAVLNATNRLLGNYLNVP